MQLFVAEKSFCLNRTQSGKTNNSVHEGGLNVTGKMSLFFQNPSEAFKMKIRSQDDIFSSDSVIISYWSRSPNLLV